MDGHGCFYALLRGNSREVQYYYQIYLQNYLTNKILSKFNVDLPKKHGKGGQSSIRFARIRIEKRHNYVRKVLILQNQ